jgi:hypothetical protein
MRDTKAQSYLNLDEPYRNPFHSQIVEAVCKHYKLDEVIHGAGSRDEVSRGETWAGHWAYQDSQEQKTVSWD